MKTETGSAGRILRLIAAILIPLLVGGFSALLTAEDMKIYGTMDQPPLAPPGWVFPIVWTILYGLMGLAATSSWSPTLTGSGKERRCCTTPLSWP